MTDFLLHSTRHDKDALFKIPFSMFAPNQVKKYTHQSEYDKSKDSKFEHYEYTINEHGFRYTEPKTDNIMLAVGCSMTYGTGLPEECVYPSIVSKTLGYELVNVALPGTGPDIQIINATWALLKYKPKIILFYMSTPSRRFLTTETDFMNWVPGVNLSGFSELENKSLTLLDDKFRFTRVLQTIWQLIPFIELCKHSNTELYFKCWDPEAQTHFMKYDIMQYTKDLPNLKSVDKARDDMHPGIESHKEFSDRILNAIKV